MALQYCNFCQLVAYMLIVVAVAVIAVCGSGAVLATADFVNYADYPGVYAYSNQIGLSMDLGEVTPYLDSLLFQGYLLNSNVFGSWSNNFNVYLHNPGGYKYNCPLMEEIANQTLSCVFDMDNATFVAQLADFYYNVSSWMKMAFGWDNQGADFSISRYNEQAFVVFAVDLFLKHQVLPLIETGDKADTYNATGIRPNYNFTQPAQDCSDINNYLSFYYTSPGLTQNASKEWYLQFDNIYWQCGIITARGTVFPDPTLLTIDNLLSQNYTSEFIKRRFTVNGTSFVNDISYYGISINDLRLVEAYEGVNGLTNSFAAAIWAIEFTMEWIIMGGYQASFFNPIGSPSFQSILGQAPSFQPTALYYGLLFVISANYLSPWVMIPTVSVGSSSKIKAYGFDNYDHYSFLLLNKDSNSSAKGTVSVYLSYKTGIRCMFLSAASLNSTAGISLNGYSFTSNNSNAQGEFAMKTYQVDADGVYNVPLSYSEVIFCRSIISQTYYNFPRFSSSSGSPYVFLYFFLITLLLLF